MAKKPTAKQLAARAKFVAMVHAREGKKSSAKPSAPKHTSSKSHKVTGLPTNHHPGRSKLSHPDMPPQANMPAPQMGTPGQPQPGGAGGNPFNGQQY